MWVIECAVQPITTLNDVGYYDTPLGHSTRATERESIKLSITLAAILCVVAAQRQLAALRCIGKTNSSPRGDESDETIKTITRVFFSDYDRRKQLMLFESESSLLDQRLALRSSPRGAAFRLIAQPGVDHSSYRGVHILVLF